MTIDELGDYGMVRMDDEETRGFLSSQTVGVLGFQTEGAPCMRPMSYWYDGEFTLYFLYVLGDSSRKQRLSSRSDAARFLVYQADSAYEWRSVLLTGTIDEVPESKRDDVREVAEMKWRPELFERAGASENTKFYRFEIDDRVGIKHSELPPGFERDHPETRAGNDP